MIPKVIHYCWFGGNPLPNDAIKCIESWKKFFPEYEIKEWNESNFDISCCDYVKEAYASKKWAFVSDYARFVILYNEGGLYFDTDVEVIRPFDSIIKNGPFMGKEASLRGEILTAPGLGLAAVPGLPFYKEIIDYYQTKHDEVDEKTTVCNHITSLLKGHGYLGNNEVEQIAGMVIYPPEYFCPKNYYTGELNITSNTYSIHHYSATWYSKKELKMLAFQSCIEKKNRH